MHEEFFVTPWTAPSLQARPTPMPVNTRTDCLVTIRDPEGLEALGRVQDLHTLDHPLLNDESNLPNKDWLRNLDIARLNTCTILVLDQTGKPLSLDQDHQPDGLEVVHVPRITTTIAITDKNGSFSLTYPIDVATTGCHGNHPRCRVYLAKGPRPSISRLTGIIRHLYFEPYPDINNNNPATQMLAFTDETMTELASQILSRTEAQRVILEHRFRTYVQPYLFNVPYSLYGNRESLHVLAQEPSSTD